MGLHPGIDHAEGLAQQDGHAEPQRRLPDFLRGGCQRQIRAHQQVPRHTARKTQHKRMVDDAGLGLGRRRHEPWHHHLRTAHQRQRSGNQHH
ncbi:hypothetical protein D3C81_1553920 [compost metagenome]